jgi:penicillin amidase
VIFTEGDIPHIYAENTDDLGRTLGFLMGRDRFFTMDLIRRLGTGSLSGLLGELALDVDYESRSIGMTYVADRLNDSMSEKASRYLTAISEGLNAYITAVEAGEMLAPTEYVLAASLF